MNVKIECLDFQVRDTRNSQQRRKPKNLYQREEGIIIIITQKNQRKIKLMVNRRMRKNQTLILPTQLLKLLTLLSFLPMEVVKEMVLMMRSPTGESVFPIMRSGMQVVR